MTNDEGLVCKFRGANTKEGETNHDGLLMAVVAVMLCYVYAQ